jgi:DNA-binding response OmpR family regulator
LIHFDSFRWKYLCLYRPVDAKKITPTNTQHTILAVDDDESTRELLDIMLTNAGFLVTLAESGEEALNMALTSEPDLAVLDIQIPGMSGLELARNLREETAIPFMFLTVLGDIDIAKQAATYGGVGYMVKPI